MSVRVGESMTHAAQAESPPAGGTWLIWVLGVLWAVGIAVALTVGALAGFTPEGPDEWTYDWRTLFFSQSADKPRDDIAIILIDEDSMGEYDYISPVDRGLVAKLLQALDTANPKAVGLDFIYDRRSEEAKTQALIDTIKGMHSPIVFGAIDSRIRGFKAEDLKYQEDFIAKTGREAGHVFFARAIGSAQDRRSGRAVHGRALARSAASQKHRPAPGGNRRRQSPSPPASPYIAWLLPPPGRRSLPAVPRAPPQAGCGRLTRYCRKAGEPPCRTRLC